VDFLGAAYPWLKALHIISVIVWLGAQLLLPALLMALRGLPAASPQSVLLLGVARQLITRLMNPAMLVAFVLGALLASVVIDAGGQLPRWLGFKLGLVFILSALHGLLLRQFRAACAGRTPWSTGGYRLVQGVDVLLLAGIVGLVVIKPPL
jgi:putative membrane protein